VARGRMLDKCISTSRKVGSLRTDFHRLLYTWLIPHTDDFGLMDGDPYHIRYGVVPTLSRSEKQIIEALTAIKDAGLINWYRYNGTPVIEVVAFEEHQTGLHKRTTSKYQTLEDAYHSDDFRELPGTSAPTEGTEGTEQNGKSCLPDGSGKGTTDA